MTKEEFEKMVADEWEHAVPEKFRSKIKNVAFLVEGDPSFEVRTKEGLGPNQTLLGYYQGIPHTARGDWYGVGSTMPDTITLYQNPIEQEAVEQEHSDILKNIRISREEYVRTAIRDTIWHEVAHHFGMDEDAVRTRERKRNKSR